MLETELTNVRTNRRIVAVVGEPNLPPCPVRTTDRYTNCRFVRLPRTPFSKRARITAPDGAWTYGRTDRRVRKYRLSGDRDVVYSGGHITMVVVGRHGSADSNTIRLTCRTKMTGSLIRGRFRASVPNHRTTWRQSVGAGGRLWPETYTNGASSPVGRGRVQRFTNGYDANVA